MISQGNITSQARLVELLEAEGFQVTQATVSRDLDALGAVKSRDESGLVHYSMTTNPVALSEAELRLRRAVSDFVDAISVSGDIVVLHPTDKVTNGVRLKTTQNKLVDGG